MDHSFSIREAMVFGWHKVREHSGLLFQVVLTIFALQIAGAIVERVLGDTLEGALASVAITVVAFFVSVGFTIITLRLAKGESAAYGDLLPHWRVVWHFFVVSILVSLITLAPVLAGIVFVALLALLTGGAAVFTSTDAFFSQPILFGMMPIVALAVLVAVAYLALRYNFSRLAVVDEAGIIGSLRRSAQMTRGVKWRLVGLMLALLGINVLGFLALFVGLLVTIPLSALAFAHVYLKLKKHA